MSPHRNRVYVAWTRLSRTIVASIVISHSDDGGQTWSRPVKVNRTGTQLTYASIGVSRSGEVYVAWTDVENFGIIIARSSDGGNHFGPEQEVGIEVSSMSESLLPPSRDPASRRIRP